MGTNPIGLCLDKKRRLGHRHTERRLCEGMRRWLSTHQGERPREKPTLLTPWSWAASLKNCENVPLCVCTQSCPTLLRPMDCSRPDSSVSGISQARILECVAILFSRGSSHPGIEPGSPALQAGSLRSQPPGKPLKEFKD